MTWDLCCPVSPTPVQSPQVKGKVFNLTGSCFLEQASGDISVGLSRAAQTVYSYALHSAVTGFHPLRPVWSPRTCAQLQKSIKVFVLGLKTQITYCLPGSFLPMLITLVLKKPKPQLQIIFESNLVSRTTSLHVVMPHPTSPKIFLVTKTPSAYGL